MTPLEPRDPWARLAAAARRAADDRDAEAPYGFATRVAALALAAEQRAGSLVERFALRALGVAGLLALASVAANYHMLPAGGTAIGSLEEEVITDDALAAVLEVSD